MNTYIANRFRKFLPVVIDVETGGFNPDQHALLEVAAISVICDDDKQLITDKTWHNHIIAHPDCIIDDEALKFNGIKPDHPLRFAIDEAKAMNDLKAWLKEQLKEQKCERAILVGHNAHFDLSFINSACMRNNIILPLHKFSVLDTTTLGALAVGQTVLAKIIKALDIEFDQSLAHSAIYDTQKTAEAFCKILNHYSMMI